MLNPRRTARQVLSLWGCGLRGGRYIGCGVQGSPASKVEKPAGSIGSPRHYCDCLWKTSKPMSERTSSLLSLHQASKARKKCKPVDLAQ